jgi:predicted DNA-binding transcriptional regulator AlpA
MKPNDALIRLPEVLKLVGFSKSAWYRHVKKGNAPRPVVSYNKFAAWSANEIQAYIERLKGTAA